MKSPLACFVLFVLVFTLAHSSADPALTFHAAPKPLPKGAVVEDWPRFLGLHDNCTSGETKLLKKWPAEGPKKVWELATGEGYASPVFAEGRLVYFHRFEFKDTPARDDGEEVIDCLDPETGKRHWRFTYPVSYRDRYGFSPGPRGSAVLHKGKVKPSLLAVAESFQRARDPSLVYAHAVSLKID